MEALLVIVALCLVIGGILFVVYQISNTNANVISDARPRVLPRPTAGSQPVSAPHSLAGAPSAPYVPGPAAGFSSELGLAGLLPHERLQREVQLLEERGYAPAVMELTDSTRDEICVQAQARLPGGPRFDDHGELVGNSPAQALTVYVVLGENFPAEPPEVGVTMQPEAGGDPRDLALSSQLIARWDPNTPLHKLVAEAIELAKRAPANATAHPAPSGLLFNEHGELIRPPGA